VIIYEYPLSERIRTLLRIEDLFEKIAHFRADDEGFAHHAALLTLFEMLEVASRSDLKTDLLQEIERQRQSLETLRNNPGVETTALDKVLKEMNAATTGLVDMTGKIGQELKDNEWLMAIKQRTTIPGGACEFDLPGYHLWLNGPAEARRKDIASWAQPLMPIVKGLAIVLKLLRESGSATEHVAYGGMYQQMLAGRTAQMLRLWVAKGLPCSPEISANKYALNIRFMTPAHGKPRLWESDVEFRLMFCNL
jgi:cell division protein ZapD